MASEQYSNSGYRTDERSRAVGSTNSAGIQAVLQRNHGNLNANIEDYLSPWGGCIIMNGIIYYNTPQNAETPRYGYYAVDLYTGKRMVQ
jgi:hypothetical protein